jgi:hypothetical protein
MMNLKFHSLKAVMYRTGAAIASVILVVSLLACSKSEQPITQYAQNQLNDEVNPGVIPAFDRLAMAVGYDKASQLRDGIGAEELDLLTYGI